MGRRKESKGFRVFFALYATIVFHNILFAKVHYCHRLLQALEKTGYIERITEGPLSFLGWGMFLFGIPIFVLIVFLPQVLRLTRIRDGALQRFLYVAIVFWIFSFLSWFATKVEVSYLAYFLTYGAVLGIIEGVWRVPIHPSWLDDTSLSNEGKCEMLKFEDTKWWRGLKLFWVGIIAIVVTGVINWVTSPAPADEALRKLPALKIQEAFILAFSSIPGIALVIWNIIQRANYIQKKLGDLYKKSGDK
jgi:hypothetical protein